MVKFKTNVDRNGRIYLAKPLRESGGLIGSLEILPNSQVAIIYKSGTTIDDILASLEIIIAYLKHKAKRGA
jgi:bifunctional DNA-binding transcriptional regulator/antitoxin component of YhaV-PrlF toxin-antitoxin module